ncbi:MAG: peptidoglycan editing factor PgeF [Oscillospiraceae bacterium]|jgi:YfiH family protein|nr:peptidoglycan editing factor PgeF [Oscillospiraceae bacterium]
MIFKSNNTELSVKKAVPFFTFPIFEKHKLLRHGFSTRLGGVSSNEFESMNFRFFGSETMENIIQNYRKFSQAVGVKFESLFSARQVHSDTVMIVTNKDKRDNTISSKNRQIQNADGLITDQNNLTLITYHADCTPIFFFDPLKKIIALAHSGFKGTAKEIASKIIVKMHTEFLCNPEDIICAIGPTISQKCYEVDDAVYEKFRNKPWIIESCFIKSEKNNNRYMLSLKKANEEILKRSGIKPENIYVSDICTHCFSDMLFSHRAMGEKRGVMAAALCMTS